jgi:hypothetical protein
MNISKQIINIINEEKLPKGAEEILPNFHIFFYRMFTEFYHNGTTLFKVTSSFTNNADKQLVKDTAIEHFSKIDFTKDRAALISDGKANVALKKFRSALAEKLTSELERYGLGKAPFRFIGVMDSPPKEMQDKNPEGYNNALQQFPRFDAGGIGSCARCYNAITTHYIIKSADGKTFPLGSECVSRLHDKKTEDEAKKAALKLSKAKSDKRNDTKKDELKELLDNPDIVAKLKAIPKENHKDYDKWPDSKKQWWDSTMGGKTYYDDIMFKYKGSGTAGKIRLLKELKKVLGIK